MIDTSRILAVDVGAGTQDILLYESDRPMENCAKMVLPSQTTILAGRIQKATRLGRPIFLTGNLMGGGPCVSAMKKHIRVGLMLYAMPLAAKTVRDNPEEVRALSIEIVTERPERNDLVTLHTHDVNLETLSKALALFDVTLPPTKCIAVQDHGEDLTISQRRFRFSQWERFVVMGGDILRLAYQVIPPHLTRMRAVRTDVPGAILMDTGPAAIWGALEDERVVAYREEGLIVVNIGNQHTIAVLLQAERIWGLFEHHTVLMNPEKLRTLIGKLREGTISNGEVFGDNGHGACVHPDYRPERGFRFVTVTGPNRHMARGLGFYMAVPHGDMMLTGCFGLVAAVKRLAEIAEV